MPAKRSPLEQRRAAQKLSALMLAEDDAALERFRKQRLAGRDAPLEHLALIRDLLDALATQLDDADPEALSRALALLLEEAAPDTNDLGERAPAPEQAPPEDEPPRVDAPEAPPITAQPILPYSESPWERPFSSLAAPRPPPGAPLRPLRSAPTLPTTELSNDEITRVVPEPTPAPRAPARTHTNVGEHMHSALPFDALEEGTRRIGCMSLSHGLALGVEEYAALCAECDAFVDRRREIHDRYEIISEAQRRLLDDIYARRFRNDPALRSRFEQRYVPLLAALQRPG